MAVKVAVPIDLRFCRSLGCCAGQGLTGGSDVFITEDEPWH